MAKGRDSVRSNHCSLYIDLLLILKKELFRSLNSQRQGAIWWVLFESYFWINIMVQHTCWVSERKKLDTKKLKTEVIHFYECVIKNKKKEEEDGWVWTCTWSVLWLLSTGNTTCWQQRWCNPAATWALLSHQHLLFWLIKDPFGLYGIRKHYQC